MIIPFKLAKNSILPFYGLTLGYTVFYLSLIVLIPLSMIFIEASSVSLEQLFNILLNERVLISFYLTIKSSLIAAIINIFFGFILTWVLVRYDFWGKKVIDSLIDLPFALPTAIAGISLSAVYAEDGIIGQYLNLIGIKASYTPVGIIIALVFVGLPFVVRTLSPILQDFSEELEEAASSLGANRWQVFVRVIFPTTLPALITGFIMAFARGLGEYGAVIFIAGNIPKISEIVSLLIHIKLEQYDYQGASVIAAAMLILSFSIILIINLLQKWSTRYNG